VKWLLLEELVAADESCKAWTEASVYSSSPFSISPTWKCFQSPILFSNHVEGRLFGFESIGDSSWVVREVIAVGGGRRRRRVL